MGSKDSTDLCLFSLSSQTSATARVRDQGCNQARPVLSCMSLYKPIQPTFAGNHGACRSSNGQAPLGGYIPTWFAIYPQTFSHPNTRSPDPTWINCVGRYHHNHCRVRIKCWYRK